MSRLALDLTKSERDNFGLILAAAADGTVTIPSDFNELWFVSVNPTGNQGGSSPSNTKITIGMKPNEFISDKVTKEFYYDRINLGVYLLPVFENDPEPKPDTSWTDEQGTQWADRIIGTLNGLSNLVSVRVATYEGGFRSLEIFPTNEDNNLVFSSILEYPFAEPSGK